MKVILRLRLVCTGLYFIERADHDGSARKFPISPQMLLAYRKALQFNRSADVPTWACVLITFFGFFRNSNTTVERGALDAEGRCLRVQDVLLLDR
jgi:hypothetical protein